MYTINKKNLGLAGSYIYKNKIKKLLTKINFKIHRERTTTIPNENRKKKISKNETGESTNTLETL